MVAYDIRSTGIKLMVRNGRTYPIAVYRDAQLSALAQKKNWEILGKD